MPSDGTALDATLYDKGAARGQVVDSHSVGIADVTVDVYLNHSIIATGTTDGDGNYVVWVDNALHSDTNTYVIDYTPSSGAYQAEWSGATPNQQDASGVSISDDQGTQDTVTLPDATSITGTVTDSDGNPVAGVPVSAYETTGAYPTPSDVTTDSNGEYRFTGLAASTYSISIYGAGYAYNGDALTADLTSATTAEVDAHVSENAHIGGFVTDPAGNGVNGVNVTVFDSSGNPVTGAETATVTTSDGTEDGGYDVYGLAFGTYTLEFTPADPNAASYTDDTVGPITLSSSNYSAEKNHREVVGSTISGSITTINDSNKQPEEVTVIATSTTSSYTQYAQVTPVKAGVATAYSINGLPAGSYTVEFLPQDDNTFADQWWKGSFTQDGATSITVSPTSAATGISDTVLKVVVPADQSVKAPYSDHVDVGQTLSIVTAKHSVSVPAKTTSTYQWMRFSEDNSVDPAAIPKATKSTYKTVNADAGFIIGVEETQTAKGYAPVTTQLVNEVPVGNAIFSTVATWKLSGTAATGNVLTVTSKGAFTAPTPVTVNYYWSMNGLPVPASWSTQTVLPDPTDVNAATNTMTLGWDDLGRGNPYDTGIGFNPPADWLTKQGDVLTPEDASNDPGDPSSHDYPFDFTQLLQPQWNSQRLSVQVCASADLYKDYCKTLKVTIAKDLIKRVIPVVSHSSGSTLFTAAAGVWHSSTYLKGTVALKYQWFAGNTPIAGATKASFTSTAAQSGQVITVHVTGTAKGYTTATTYSLSSPTAP